MNIPKIINDPENFVDGFLAGIANVHPTSHRFDSADGRAVVTTDEPAHALSG